MGYNLKSARNGKSTLKIPQWPSLRPLQLKSKFIRQFEFSENLVVGEQGIALTNQKRGNTLNE